MFDDSSSPFMCAGEMADREIKVLPVEYSFKIWVRGFAANRHEGPLILRPITVNSSEVYWCHCYPQT